MSVVTVAGVRMVAEMLWIPALEKAEIRKAKKAGRRNHSVKYGELIGLVDGEGGAQGQVPLAPTVARVVGPHQGSWVVALAAEEGLVCLIHQQDGSLGQSGDLVFDREEDAWERFELVRGVDCRAFVGPGVFESERGRFAEFHMDALASTAGSMARVERDKSGGKQTLVLALLALVVLPGGGYLVWDEFIKEPPPVVAPPIPTVEAMIDRMTFVAGCENTRRRILLHVAGWRLKRVTCTSQFGVDIEGVSETSDSKKERDIASVHGEFSDMPVMLAEWVLVDGFEEAVWRRIAEQQLASRGGWDVVQVVERQAWAAVKLPSVLMKANVGPTYLDYRNMVEQAFALQGVEVTHGPQPASPQGNAATKLSIGFGLAAFYEMIRPIEGLEVMRLMTRRESDGWGWIAELRKQQTQILEEPVFFERQVKPPRSAANRSG